MWNKKNISKAEIDSLQKKYGIDAITASIMVRRGITEGRDILYFMEDDLRFQHSPFLFSSMEDAVDRILNAKEEQEKVLIFGDRDVDGVTATTVLYDCLESMGINVSYRLPLGDDVYGLSMAAVEDFSTEDGTLIITVDCGISNNAEVQRASELGIDVIILDHHNPPSALPSPAIIVDPKLSDSGYPFADISGCAVVYKTVSALRFSQSQWYKLECTLLNITENVFEGKDSYVIECIKLRNLVPVSRIKEETLGGDIMATRLPEYLRGQVILVWDKKDIEDKLKKAFGTGTEFNMLDIHTEASKYIPHIEALPLSKIMVLSKMARYGNHEPTEIGGFYNIFVSYVNQTLKAAFPQNTAQEEKDLQLVALAALADIMPMQNENRLFVKHALNSINKERIRPGLLELMSKVNLLGKHITSTDLSWVLVSNLNAAGRLGHPELAAELFITKDNKKREETAKNIVELNNERKQLSQDALNYAAIQAETSIPLYNNKLCLVIDERINRGVCGILAGRLVSNYNVPSIVVTFVDNNIAIGSMRTCRGVKATEFLDKFGDIFLNHGGHNAAAGFNFERNKVEAFCKKAKELSAEIELESPQTDIEIDAEIPQAWLTPKLLDIKDRFEPFGEKNKPLLFMSKNLKVQDAQILGKTEKQHLKITVEGGNCKWPALFWNEGERLNKDFCKGDNIDMIFHVERNTFNGMENPQIIIQDLKKSSAN